MTKVCLMCGETFPDATTFCAKDGSALRAAVQGDHLIGEVFCDRYVVTDLLGEGGMGAVYAASDVRLPQQVAIKVLREQGMADPSVVQRFKHEAEAASRINHDRVARVTDFGFMTDGRAFLVMEFVGGRTLKQVATDRGPMPPDEVSRIVTMVAEGLDAAHRLGIVHRDLKPDNVMVLDDAGGGVRVKVLDFGIAKFTLGNEESAGQTKTGFVIGTPQWMSPEQILGETLDGRSDVYSLALLAYFMLTGRRAFESATAEAEMMTRLASQPRSLSEALPSMQWPNGLQELFNRTLSRDVNDRPAGALAFAKEFASVVGAGNTVAMGAANSLTAAQGGASYNTRTPSAPDVASPTPASSLSRDTSSAAAVSGNAGQPPAKRSMVLPAVIGLAAVAAVAFFVVRPFGDSGNEPASTTPGVSTVARGDNPAPDASNSAAINPPPVTPSAASADSAGLAANAASNVAANTKAPETQRPSGGTNPASTPGASTPPATRSGATGNAAPTNTVPQRGTAPAPTDAPTPQQIAAAHSELTEVLNSWDGELSNGADANIVRVRAREIIRKLEALQPRLASDTDKGNAHLYTAMAYATIGDNAKACAALSRAEPLSGQSSGLQRNVADWQQQLRCGN